MRSRLNLFANILTSEQSFSERTTKLLAILSLVISASLCLFSYTSRKLFFFQVDVSIRPSLISGITSIVMLAPLYARGILGWSKSVYGVLVFVLLSTVYAGIIEIAIGGKTGIPEYLVAAAAMLSWLGMRGVAGFSWILAFAACLFSIIETNGAMGFYGFIFIMTAFLGCLFHSGLGPADFLRDITEEFHIRTESVGKRIATDTDVAANLAGKKYGLTRRPDRE